MHKITTKIHIRQLTTIHRRHLKIQNVQKVNNTKVRKYCIEFLVFFPTHNVLTLSPQPFTSHHFTTHANFSKKVSFFPLPCTALHFTSLHFTFRWFSLHFTSLLYTFKKMFQASFVSIFPSVDARFFWASGCIHTPAAEYVHRLFLIRALATLSKTCYLKTL